LISPMHLLTAPKAPLGLAIATEKSNNGKGSRGEDHTRQTVIRSWPEGHKMNPYSSLCDDFGLYVYVNTKMELPSKRETVLHFFDSLQKTFPQMTDFDCRESGEYVLEEDREQGSYRWVTLE